MKNFPTFFPFFFSFFWIWGFFVIACFMTRKCEKCNKKIYPTGHVKKKIGYFPTLGGRGGLRKVGIFQLFFLNPSLIQKYYFWVYWLKITFLIQQRYELDSEPLETLIYFTRGENAACWFTNKILCTFGNWCWKCQKSYLKKYKTLSDQSLLNQIKVAALQMCPK